MDWSAAGRCLERAGAGDGALEVILEGADRGEIKEAPRPPGEIHYARSLPIAKAKKDVLLAYAMNGEPLAPMRGFPLRAIVPGWFGMAAVKWLHRIIVTDKPFNGYYQSIDYTYWERRDGNPTLVPLGEMQTKAQIAQPAMGERVRAGTRYRVHGAAWGGEIPVKQVELSCDGGGSWVPVTLAGDAVPNSWRLWEFLWDVPAEAGPRTLIARATDDAAGRSPRTASRSTAPT
jgi:DMSO/TMAO reductase YedYZ molybdopterin-dependent catalytic subunit